MFVRTATSLILGTALFLAVMWGTGHLPAIAKDGLVNEPEPVPQETFPTAEAKQREPGKALYVTTQQAQPIRTVPQEPAGIAKDCVVISNAHLGLIQKEDVPSQRDGVLRMICSEVRPEDRAKYPGQIIQIMVGDSPRYYRR